MEPLRVELEGQVRSGLGDASLWMRRLASHYERLTGCSLFPGTLNVEVPEDWRVPSGAICLRAADYGGHVSIYVVPCEFMGEPAWVLRTFANEEERGDHPRTIVEIASTVELRARYQLVDGATVQLRLPVGAF